MASWDVVCACGVLFFKWPSFSVGVWDGRQGNMGKGWDGLFFFWGVVWRFLNVGTDYGMA